MPTSADNSSSVHHHNLSVHINNEITENYRNSTIGLLGPCEECVKEIKRMRLPLVASDVLNNHESFQCTALVSTKDTDRETEADPCLTCLDKIPSKEELLLRCEHRVCTDCMTQYWTHQVMNEMPDAGLGCTRELPRWNQRLRTT